MSTTLTVLILHNVESVYFFYSNPVYLIDILFAAAAAAAPITNIPTDFVLCLGFF